MEPDGSYDAIVCRHLVWTLTEPRTALTEWHRVLKPGGHLLIFDGDWAQPTWIGKAASLVIKHFDRFLGPDLNYDGAMSERHAAIMAQLSFGSGLTTDVLVPMLGSRTSRSHPTVRSRQPNGGMRHGATGCEHSSIGASFYRADPAPVCHAAHSSLRSTRTPMFLLDIDKPKAFLNSDSALEGALCEDLQEIQV